MGKEYVVETSELIQFALDQKFGKKRHTTAQWNSLCNKVTPDGVALSESGGVTHDLEGVEELLVDDPKDLYALNLKAYMKRHRIKSLRIVAG